MTRETAREWVGRTIWQVHGDGVPVSYEFIGVAKQHDLLVDEPARFSLHVLQDASLPQSSHWDSSAPAFLSRGAALEYTLTQEDRARLERIEREAFARRGFGGCGPGRRPLPEPAALDLFTFAAEVLALHTGRPVSHERTYLLGPSVSGSESTFFPYGADCGSDHSPGPGASP